MGQMRQDEGRAHRAGTQRRDAAVEQFVGVSRSRSSRAISPIPAKQSTMKPRPKKSAGVGGGGGMPWSA